MISAKWLEHMYKLQYLVRYNPQRRVNHESVAAHSFFTSVIAVRLCDLYSIKGSLRLKVIEGAIIHDTPESFTNDITHDVKEAIPEIDALLDRFERGFVQEHFPNSFDALFGEDDESILAKKLIKLSDTFSVVQYCNNEISMGNTGFFELRDSAIMRVQQMIKSLERSGLECQETQCLTQLYCQ